MRANGGWPRYYVRGKEDQKLIPLAEIFRRLAFIGYELFGRTSVYKTYMLSGILSHNNKF